ncbi:MAG: phosphopentomutase, partial [Pseudomonadota bacterium]
PAPTLLDVAEDDGRAVFAVGKIADIFAHRGVTDIRKASGNEAMMDATLQAMDDAANGDLVFTNFVDFDTEFGHRRDVAGYAACLEAFDRRVPELLAKLRDGDLMVFTADHGNDPTWTGTDHTREQVFALLTGPQIPIGPCGTRETFADIGATVAAHLGLPWNGKGTDMLAGAR